MINDFDIPGFSGDDFAFDKGIQKTRAEAEAYNKMVDDSLAIFKSAFGAKETSHKNLKTFLMFRSLQATITWSLGGTYNGKNLHISLAKYFTFVHVGRHNYSGDDLYLFGYFIMRNSFPKTYVCKETMREWITDLFLNSEVDFEHSKKFSRKFYVLTEDKERLSVLLQFKDLDELAAYPDMELEFQGNACLFRSSRKCISFKEAEVFTELAKTLIRIFA